MNYARHVMVLIAGLSLTGCDYNSATDNGQVTVKNRTDDTIIVHYESEHVTSAYDCTCDGVADHVDVGIAHQHAHVATGKEATLYVDSFGFWDGAITVENNGELRTYDIDFDFFGFDTVWIREDDFLPKSNG